MHRFRGGSDGEHPHRKEEPFKPDWSAPTGQPYKHMPGGSWRAPQGTWAPPKGRPYLMLNTSNVDKNPVAVENELRDIRSHDTLSYEDFMRHTEPLEDSAPYLGDLLQRLGETGFKPITPSDDDEDK